MKESPNCIAALAALCVCLAAVGCGTMGEPVYPSAHIPIAPTDLNAVERGNRIVVQFTAPAYTTDAQVMAAIGGADVRIGIAPTPFNADKWAASAIRATVQSAEKPGPIEGSAPISAALIGKDVTVGARVLNRKGRASAWSNLVTVHLIQPVAAPTDVVAAAAPEGVRISWSDPGEHSFRLFRKGPNDPQPAEIGKSATSPYIDSTIVWGTKYDYWVQALRDHAQSDTAAAPALTPEDRFPPAIPVGLTAVTGVNSIELAWERNSESTLKNYIVYRAVGDGPLEELAETDVPVYSDKSVQAGKRYRYAVAAVKQNGFSSDKSPAVEASAP